MRRFGISVPVLAIGLAMVVMAPVRGADSAPAAGEAGAAGAAAVEGGEASSGACPVLREADVLLGEAGSASSAAVRWLSANLSPSAVSAVAETAQRAAECRWRALVSEVRAETARALGAFLYTPGSGTACDGDWTPIGEMSGVVESRRVVLLVHGLDEPGDIWNDLAPALRDAGLTVACFNYPNDQDPALSGDALGASLRALRAELGAERVDLVCHSMGGLVARDVLTRPGLYGGDGRAHDGLPAVGRLITVGTPNHGSPLAPLRALGEVREHFARWIGSEATDRQALLGFLADGDGAAADALDPGSAYLTELNGRGLPEGVEMTVIIGRVSPVDSVEVDELLESSWVSRALGAERTARLRAQAAEAVSMAGDAIVTVDSARLDGVEDTVILEANHRSLVRRIPLADSMRRFVGERARTPPAIPVIVHRLTEDDEE